MQELTTTLDRDPWFIELWLHGRPEKTQEAYRADMARFKDYIGKPLPAVTLEDLQAFSDSLVDLKPASKNRTIAAVKSALSFGVKMNYLPTNVGLLVKLPRLENKLAERIMSEQAIDDILRLEQDPRNRAMLTLLYYGGLRVSEVCSLTWRNLQERDESGQIAVFGKGNKTRYVLLDADTWRMVWALRGDAPLEQYVFPSRQSVGITRKKEVHEKGERLDPSRVHQIVRAAADRAGIALGKVSPHWFRHAHATHALKAGASIALVKETLGHESIETTAKYTHVMPNESSSLVLRAKRKGH
jgi:integrase/recombinase XerD